MAYARRPYRRRRYGSRYAHSTRWKRGRTSYRGSSSRFARKRVYRRPRTLTKKIMAVSRRKKLDTMLPYTKASPYDDVGNPGGVSFTTSARIHAFGFVATGRSLAANSTNRGIISDDATRTATETYMKSYTERIYMHLETNDPVRWRRICFTWKGPSLFTANLASGGTGAEGSLILGNNDGFHRAITTLFPSSGDSNVIWLQFLDIMFLGQFNADWSDIMSAPLDRRRINVKSDYTTILQSKNDTGTFKQLRRSYRLSSTLIYNDDEQGGGKLETFYSSLQKRSMGDFYIIDLFDFGEGLEGQSVHFTPEAQLRWTER